MRVVSMDELEAMYGLHDGALLALEDIGVSRSAVNDVMLNEVADLVQEILEKHISQDVYAAYSPKKTYYGKRPPVGWISVDGDNGHYMYARRWSLYDNFVRKMEGDTLFVTSDATPNKSVIGTGWSHNVGGFLQMIGTNPGRIWRGRFPRPAIQRAQEEIENNGYAQRAIAEAFARGIKRHK